MLSLEEFIRLKTDFISGNINLEEAKNIVWKDLNENSRSFSSNRTLES